MARLFSLYEELMFWSLSRMDLLLYYQGMPLRDLSRRTVKTRVASESIQMEIVSCEVLRDKDRPLTALCMTFSD